MYDYSTDSKYKGVIDFINKFDPEKRKIDDKFEKDKVDNFHPMYIPNTKESNVLPFKDIEFMDEIVLKNKEGNHLYCLVTGAVYNLVKMAGCSIMKGNYDNIEIKLNEEERLLINFNESTTSTWRNDYKIVEIRKRYMDIRYAYWRNTDV